MPTITQNNIEIFQTELAGAMAAEIVAFATDHLQSPVFATSLGQEDQAATLQQ